MAEGQQGACWTLCDGLKLLYGYDSGRVQWSRRRRRLLLRETKHIGGKQRLEGLLIERATTLGSAGVRASSRSSLLAKLLAQRGQFVYRVSGCFAEG
jgi:hypothetical protein